MGGNERRQCKWNSSEWNPASFRWVSAPSGCYAAIYCMKRCNNKLVGMRVEISRQKPGTMIYKCVLLEWAYLTNHTGGAAAEHAMLRNIVKLS